MAHEANKNVLRRFITDAWVGGDLSVIDEIMDERYDSHPVGRIGAEGMKEHVRTFREAFPDLTIEVEDLIADDDTAVVRTTLRGTHRGEIFGIPPTGRSVEVATIGINRIVDGTILEGWGEMDLVRMLEQLSTTTGQLRALVMPATGGPAALAQADRRPEPSVNRHSEAAPSAAASAASVDENKAALRRVVEATSTGNLAVVDEVFDRDVLLHDLPPGLPSGSEGVKAAIAGFTAAFADTQATLDVLVGEGDRVVARVTLSGTHRAEFMGVPATGKQVTWTGIDIARFEGGKIVEVWRLADTLGLLQQLGATAPAPAESNGHAPRGLPADELKAIFQRYIDELWNEGRLDRADEMFSPDYIAHMPADPERERGRGPEVIKQYVSLFRAAFPDLKVELHALVAEGNEVAARGVVSGTFQGELFGIPPTGARATWTLTGFDKFDEDGKITDGWGDMDMLGALQKLGVIPAPGEVPTGAREERAA